MAEGHEVVVVDNLSTGNPANLPAAARLEEIPLESESSLDLVKSFRPEAIFHFAAQIDVRVSTSRPVYDAQQNIINSLRLLECGLQHGLSYFAFASSGGAIYGEPVAGPQDEDHPERPLSPYGVAKLSIDNYLAALRHHPGLPSCSMRFSNVYGPRQNNRGEAGVVSLLISRALAGLPLKINGSGHQTRDFIHVSDLARAGSLLLARRPQGVLNFGTGIETSIGRLANLLGAQFCPAPEIRYSPAIPGEQVRSVLNFSKAKRVLGWAPTTMIEEGIPATVRWFAQAAKSPAPPPEPARVS